MSLVQVRTDRPIPEIARACVDALLDGLDVEVPAAVWQRTGLSRAIAAEQRARGVARGVWRFTAEGDSGPQLPDAGDILGWGNQLAEPAPDSRRARRAVAAAPVHTTPAMAPTPAPVPAPAVRRPVHVNHPAVYAPVIPTPPPVAAPVPVVQFGQTLSQASAMMQAAYALVAFTQPVMAGGLKPGRTHQRAFGAPLDTRPRWTAAQAMAELADLDGL